MHIAKLHYERTKKAVQFLPVAVNKKVGGIRIGKPIRFDAASPFGREKQRLKRELESTVYSLYCAMEKERVKPPKEALCAVDQ